MQTDQLKSHAPRRCVPKSTRGPPAAGKKGRRLKYETLQRSTAAEPSLQPLTDFCQALLSSNEFLYVD